MPSLSDLVSQQTKQFAKSNTAGSNLAKNIAQQGRVAVDNAVQSVKQLPGQVIQQGRTQVEQAVVGGVRNAVNNVVNAGRGAVQGAINAGVNGVLGAGSQLLKGNVSGALEALTQGGANVIKAGGKALDNVGSIFGISSGSKLGPTTSISQFSSSMSGNGGVTPGDALGGALARTDPIMTYCWYAELPVITAPTGSASLPWYFVEGAQIPFREFSTRSIFRDGRNKHYAGTYSVSNLGLEFYADTAMQSLQYLYAWNSAIMTDFAPANAVTAGGVFNVPNVYKKSINVHLLSVTRQELVTITYTECWPQNISEINLGSQGAERVVFRVNFSVGDVFIRLYNLATPGTALGGFEGLSRTDTSGIAVNPAAGQTPPFSPDTKSFPIPSQAPVEARSVPTPGPIEARPL